MSIRKVCAVAFAGLAIVAMSAHAHAQVEELLSSYTGANGVAYMDPLKDAIGSNLSDGLYMSGHVPRAGFHARLDVRAMVVKFDDDERTFMGVTEDYFPAEFSQEVPTVIGDEDAVAVTDPGTGAVFLFPGGFNIDNFALAVPQLTIGSVMGTEATIRYIAVDIGEESNDGGSSELGNLSLFGIGGRHSISQYFPGLPVDASAMFFYQRLQIGDDDLLVAQGQSFGIQVSKRFPIIEPYGGLAIDTFDMDVTYKTDVTGQEEEIDLDFDRETTGHFTAGLGLHFGFLHLNGEVNIASQTSFAAGLGLGL
ncbi:MAG: DUF6588 family protein [bacterium]